MYETFTTHHCQTQLPCMYYHYTYCMHVITGTLNSSVMAGPLKSKEFSLQTRDGVVRCLYWEMDRPLPHLVQGRHLRYIHVLPSNFDSMCICHCMPPRVVGVWEERSQWVKCHCVREASQQEVQCTHQMVALADSAMREAVARVSEIWHLHILCVMHMVYVRIKFAHVYTYRIWYIYIDVHTHKNL